MTTKLLLLRHGESVANRQHIFASHLLYPLTAKGHEQARQTALYLRNEKIDCIYSSDLPRAYETAEHIAEYFSLPIRTHTGLREIYAGEWEGITFKQIAERYPEDFAVWLNDIGSCHLTGGESVRDMQARAIHTIEQIVMENIGKTICISTHATVLRALQCLWSGKELCDMKDIEWSANASITSVCYEEDMSFHDLFIGQCSHLDTGNITMPVHC